MDFEISSASNEQTMDLHEQSRPLSPPRLVPRRFSSKQGFSELHLCLFKIISRLLLHCILILYLAYPDQSYLSQLNFNRSNRGCVLLHAHFLSASRLVLTQFSLQMMLRPPIALSSLCNGTTATRARSMEATEYLYQPTTSSYSTIHFRDQRRSR